MTKQTALSSILFFTTVLFLVSCQKEMKISASGEDAAVGAARVGDQIKKSTYYGPSVALGNGSARVVYSMNPAGKPKELGVEITEAALQSLPAASSEIPAYSYVLDLPMEATQATPYKHVYLDWNPTGHEPEMFYGVPHFDFHFYMTSSAEREAIPPYTPATAAQFDNYPPAGYLPATYVPSPGGVPQMGKHWIDPASPEFNGHPFTYTFIYGTYNGHVTFMEPMITLSTLLTKTSYRLPVPQPDLYAASGMYYPKEYTIYYDDAGQKFYVSLTDFKQR